MHELLCELHSLAEQLQQQCQVRELANIICACACLSNADTASMLLPVFLQDRNLQRAQPQEVCNVLWAAATLKLQLKSQQLQQMLQRFQSVLPLATTQAMSNTLWAVATMQQQVPQQLLEQMLQRLLELLPQANPQNVANTLWACAKLQYAPLQLLSALAAPSAAACSPDSSQFTRSGQHGLGVWSAGVQGQAAACGTAAAGDEAAGHTGWCAEHSSCLQHVLVCSSAGLAAVCATGAATCSCHQ
jgi:hypothetical protein